MESTFQAGARFDGYDLAKYLVDNYIRKNKLEVNKRIQVLPVGGYDNTLALHQNFIEEQVLNAQTHILSILDGDVESLVRDKRNKDHMWNFVPDDCIMFLPVKSLEKMLKSKLFDEKDYDFIRKLRDTFYRFETDIEWYEIEYKENIQNKQSEDRKKGKSVLEEKQYFSNGKNLFSILESKAIQTYSWSKSEFRKELCSFVIENCSFVQFEEELQKKTGW